MIFKKILIFTSILTFHCAHSIETFSSSKLDRHIKTLASDEFEGRFPTTTGEEKTTAYIENEFKNIGLKPFKSNSYVQNVPLANVYSRSSSLKVDDTIYELGTDFTLRNNNISQLNLQYEGDLVFVGYGIVAPEYSWNDYQNIDVKDKVVIVLVNDPGFATEDPKLFNGREMTYYGRWTYKLEEAYRQGAKGAFVIHENEAAGYPWGVVGSEKKSNFVILADDTSVIDFQGWLHQDTVSQILKTRGKDFKDLKTAALSQDFKGLNLGVNAQFSVKNEVKYANSKNLVGYIKGQKKPNEYVLIGAHWDHLGTQIKDGQKEVFSGAIDNASGVAGMLELARVYKLNEDMLDRSVIFVSYTSEEAGLLGSQYFVQYSEEVKNKTLKGVINVDSLNPSPMNNEVILFGKNEAGLKEYLYKAAAQLNKTVVLDPVAETGLYFRSDHFNFYKKGIPSLTFMDGIQDPYYVKEKYHKIADKYNPEWNFEGLKSNLNLYYSIGVMTANQ